VAVAAPPQAPPAPPPEGADCAAGRQKAAPPNFRAV